MEASDCFHVIYPLLYVRVSEAKTCFNYSTLAIGIELYYGMCNKSDSRRLYFFERTLVYMKKMYRNYKNTRKFTMISK